MKPDWDKLGDKYSDSDSIIIADVDCTSDGGKPVCSKYGVRGYPTIKTFTGNPMGDDYKGGRKYNDLLKHVETNMGPSCGPEHKDKCSEEELKALEELLKLSASDIEAKLKETQEEMDKASGDFEEFVKGLQKQYEDAQAAKESKEEELAPKLKMLYAAQKGGAKDEL
jgi:protein disulfide-isomerase A6|mmetsp:Transcript_18596/g.57766  ORF Transcript_18596/g.57766 Transcript_18596/m.57766 type:complete len:168 (-) Transcript_18596:324-827(-)